MKGKDKEKDGQIGEAASGKDRGIIVEEQGGKNEVNSIICKHHCSMFEVLKALIYIGNNVLA